ncbi:predicted protein [Nematostella vectensis]|uniref:WSC domain-containing protein n=1 Tax=Nematostella vectensis TaxID=45351 RepID=A7SV14_NEMVE|nr:predicted protein [Nematostella vectensis]|eukprot:XP_001624558.1 predicted protein [Nematostella vectensis]
MALQFSLIEAIPDVTDYTRLGCFKDNWIRTMSDVLSMNVKSVADCAKLAARKGYSVFGVQNGKECYSKETAAATYKNLGVSSGCSNGMGGIWANEVYEFRVSYKRLGCYGDNNANRSMSKHYGKWDRDVAVRTCADNARSDGYSVFGVQSGGNCYSGADAASTYNKHGNASNCDADGTGGSLSNEVYQLQDTGKQHGCAGKTNCHISCCPYGYCNNPDAPNNYPKCYYCNSKVSSEDCTENQYLIECSLMEGAQSNCFTKHNNGTYEKGCSRDYLTCLLSTGVCSGKGSAECSYKCCSGLGCNGAFRAGVSVLFILACAVIVNLLS